jgi:hypothetical protein
MHVDELTAAHFADPRTLVTGGADNVCFYVTENAYSFIT